MKVTRRKAIQFLASTAAAEALEQSASAQTQPGDVSLDWLGNDGPPGPAGVTWGVPFARGTVSKNQTFALTGPRGLVPLQHWPLAYWPDGSMKFVGFAAIANGAGPYRLAAGGAQVAPSSTVKVTQSANTIEIDTSEIQCTIPKSGEAFLGSLRIAGREVAKRGRLSCTTENRSTAGALTFDEYTSSVRSASVEQSGPVRAVVKIDGVHKAVNGSREWLPFTIRLYFYAGQPGIRLIHTFVFDGDQEKDFIKGLGIAFDVPLREEMHNRHVRFTGEAGGVWAEPVQPASGRRVLTLPGGRTPAYADQLAGKRLPNKDAFNPAGQKLLTDWAVWDSYKLAQTTADGFTIQKRTNPESCWLQAAWGRRCSGVAFTGDVSGGVAIGLRNMWQSYPASLEIRGASQATAEIHAWMWSPEVPAMDLRHYDTKAHDLDSSYEDVQEGFSTPHGVARTSELALFATAAVPTNEEIASFAKLTQEPPLLLPSPQHIHDAKVFGIWSLPNRATPARAAMEDHLDAAFALYRKEVEQRHWYGFWDYGDVRHQHDGPRHEWRYDIGGFAWDNTELGTDVWLWYNFLRTGRADAFRMAEAITRHTSEVDVYHLGRFAGLGSRHNVRHWGDGAKESRISQAAYRRFFYYLTADERTGDLMRAVVDVDYKLLEIDPMRLASPQTTPIPYPARVRGGPDWLAFAGNWMTEWERTGDTKYRDKIIAGMDSIAAMPYGFLTGPNQLYGYDPKTGKMGVIVPDGFGSYNLTTIMGGAEVVFELNDLIDHPGWRKAWLEYGLLVRAPKPLVARVHASANFTEGMDGQYAQYGRLVAYAYREKKDPALAKKAWTLVRVPNYATTHLAPPEVLNPIDEIPGLSTNTVAQSCLEAIEILEMCGDPVA